MAVIDQGHELIACRVKGRRFAITDGKKPDLQASVPEVRNAECRVGLIDLRAKRLRQRLFQSSEAQFANAFLRLLYLSLLSKRMPD